jgi:hypothetical protein
MKSGAARAIFWLTNEQILLLPFTENYKTNLIP